MNLKQKSESDEPSNLIEVCEVFSSDHFIKVNIEEKSNYVREPLQITFAFRGG